MTSPITLPVGGTPGDLAIADGGRLGERRDPRQDRPHRPPAEQGLDRSRRQSPRRELPRRRTALGRGAGVRRPHRGGTLRVVSTATFDSLDPARARRSVWNLLIDERRPNGLQARWRHRRKRSSSLILRRRCRSQATAAGRMSSSCGVASAIRTVGSCTRPIFATGSSACSPPSIRFGTSAFYEASAARELRPTNRPAATSAGASSPTIAPARSPSISRARS